MSLRQLAEQLDISPSHLSRSIRQVDRARLTPDLVGRIAEALELSPGLLPEMREIAVVQAVRDDSKLREELYQRLPRARR